MNAEDSRFYAAPLSPTPVKAVPSSAEVVDEADDLCELEKERARVLKATAYAMALRRPSQRDDGVASNGDEEKQLKERDVAVANSSYAWAEKYRPRKPRYFNRVKTGYDWNKYNKTHYDHDNPPPKTVQGYKFNIFYPDLIDRQKVPQYVLEPCEGTNEFCIIRFTAGPPYEDVAFKIVNKEWATQRKRGFRCVFQRGNLQLSFNFKRHFYRR
eukprot:g2180.t1